MSKFSVRCYYYLPAMIIPIYSFKLFQMRPFTSADAPTLHAILNDPEVIRYMPWKAVPTAEKVQKMVDVHIHLWDDFGYGWWGLELLPEKQFIGWCGLEYLPETDEVEVGYLLGKASWGKGIASQAAGKSLEFAFTKAKLNRIVGLVHPENTGSIKVLQKIGMTLMDELDLWGMHLLRFQIQKPEHHS